MSTLTHTIAAISTPPGKGGVSVIRISGDLAFPIAERVFTPISGKPLSETKPRMQIYGYIVEDGERIDDVLLCRFPAPHSYTGEDTVEICCHGGVLITRCVLELLFRMGARAAEAGEFTKRAFINGTLSLTEAEAIGKLLDAGSREQIRLYSEPKRKLLSDRVASIRAALVTLMSSIYARIDYPDEDLGDFSDAEIISRLNNIKEDITRLLSTYRTGRAVSDGIRCAIVGKPNVGKSTIYNILVGEDAAIVTDIPGTTRDVLTHTVPLGRAMLSLCDTAGIRESESIDTVERIGIERSRKMLENCELLFAIFDNSREFDKEDEDILESISRTNAAKIAILNKADLDGKFDTSRLIGCFEKIITASAKCDDERIISELAAVTNELMLDEKILASDEPIISSARQHAALTRALDFVNVAIESLALGFAQDAVSSDVERALGAIAELDGEAVSEEVVGDIFAHFCVGK